MCCSCPRERERETDFDDFVEDSFVDNPQVDLGRIGTD